VTKVCRRCHEDLDLSSYSKDKSARDGLQKLCKACDSKKGRAYYNKNKENILYKQKKHPRYKSRLTSKTNRYSRVNRVYNLSPFEYDSLIISQDSKCAICGLKSLVSLSVDHNHDCCNGRTSCGECVRGLLCNRCNLGLGAFDDNIDKLLQAIDYLLDYTD
jgi:hypothetical protein